MNNLDVRLAALTLGAGYLIAMVGALVGMLGAVTDIAVVSSELARPVAHDAEHGIAGLYTIGWWVGVAGVGTMTFGLLLSAACVIARLVRRLRPGRTVLAEAR